MGIFNRNFNKPGPGVSKDEPRKKGAARFFELWTREFGDLVKLNLIFSVCILPSLAVFLIGLMLFYPSPAFLVSFCISLILAYPIGGAITACVYYITKMMRDDPSFVWYEFKRKFRENYRQAAPIGMLCTAFVYAQIMLWGSLLMLPEAMQADGSVTEVIINEGVMPVGPGGDLFWLIIGLFSLLLFGMLTPYIFMHFSYISLGTPGTLKNSVLMTFGHLPRSFMGALMGGIMWIAFALYFPLSMTAVPLILVFGITTSMLLCLMWVWKPFDKTFNIEETLIERMKQNDGVEEKEELL